jgi:hypothetical protein
MTMLVTLEQASAHLRRDTTEDNDDLTLKIEAASGMIIDYLGEFADTFTDSAGDAHLDSNGNPIVAAKIQAATLNLIGYLYKERDGSLEHAVPAQWGYGYLPIGVTALLYMYRKPTVA